MRVAQAGLEICKEREKEWEEEEEEEDSAADERSKAREAKFRAKYDIPDNVYLFPDETIEPKMIPYLKRHIAAFVKGELTDNDLEDLIFLLGCMDECDYGWCLIERPFNGHNNDEIHRQIRLIGTRSKRKARIPFLMGTLYGWVNKAGESRWKEDSGLHHTKSQFGPRFE